MTSQLEEKLEIKGLCLIVFADQRGKTKEGCSAHLSASCHYYNSCALLPVVSSETRASASGLWAGFCYQANKP